MSLPGGSSSMAPAKYLMAWRELAWSVWIPPPRIGRMQLSGVKRAQQLSVSPLLIWPTPSRKTVSAAYSTPILELTFGRRL